jgi:outer membrane lipoprotein-sorting protein
MGAVGAAALLPTAASASAHPVLPARSAAQLLAAVQSSTVTHLSGEVVETARLGLPELPGAGNGATLSWQTLVTGTHTARLWVNGADQQRLALLGQLAESDIVRNGSSIWTYSSDTGKASHMTLPAKSARADAADPNDAAPADAAKADVTPLAAANEALARINPTTRVSVDPTARVAGQKAYTLVLQPKQGASTVRKVLIAVDAVHNVPLRVQVFGAATRPAFETAFQSISFARPAASVFRFTPPKGSVVEAPTSAAPTSSAPEHADPADASSRPKVLGSGWSSVVVFPADPAGGSPFDALTSGPTGHAKSETAATLTRLTKHLANGDQLLSTALVNVLISHDGRVLVGAVTPTTLQQAAAGLLR